ncbi:hypothetical protein [Aeromicrobium massiliense]|uniref:hypothetical protein n=1 Tax=Aeromicrobium massiliense TaxID=1464554 RepID=UPI0003152D6A|nr:hypothetical protein [Aeromicrobium massiliense]
MTTPVENQHPRERTWIYVVACVLLGVAVVTGLLMFNGARESAQATDKADQLIAALEDAGARTPDRDQIVRVLGDDGGSTCQDPNHALRRSTLLALFSNGASGPGARPVISDSRVVQGQLLIIEIYCPEELDEFREFVDDLESADLVRD